MRAASSIGDRPVQAKCLVCVGDIQRSQNNNEVDRICYLIGMFPLFCLCT
jgi:hypothetical protein